MIFMWPSLDFHGFSISTSTSGNSSSDFRTSLRMLGYVFISPSERSRDLEGYYTGRVAARGRKKSAKVGCFAFWPTRRCERPREVGPPPRRWCKKKWNICKWAGTRCLKWFWAHESIGNGLLTWFAVSPMLQRSDRLQIVAENEHFACRHGSSKVRMVWTPILAKSDYLPFKSLL